MGKKADKIKGVFKKNEEKTPKQEKSQKQTSFAVGTNPLNARVDRTVTYHRTEVPASNEHGARVVTNIEEVQTRTIPATTPNALMPASNNASQGSSSGWNAWAIGGAVCVAAYSLPIVAAGATAAIGYGALATTATLISKNIIDVNRANHESDNEVRKHEISVEGENRRHETEARERVVTRMVDRGQVSYDTTTSAGLLGPYSAQAIEGYSEQPNLQRSRLQKRQRITN